MIAMTSRSLTAAFLLFLMIVATVIAYTGYAYATSFRDGYSQGYRDGYKGALYARPPSDDLELVCAGLWMGEQSKIYEGREALEREKKKWK